MFSGLHQQKSAPTVLGSRSSRLWACIARCRRAPGDEGRSAGEVGVEPGTLELPAGNSTLGPVDQ